MVLAVIGPYYSVSHPDNSSPAVQGHHHCQTVLFYLVKLNLERRSYNQDFAGSQMSTLSSFLKQFVGI